MSIDQIVIDIIVALLPLIAMLSLWMFKQLERRLPEKQAQALDWFVKYAVRSIEHTNTGTDAQKKNEAITLIYSFFDTMRLPMPPHLLIDAAVDALFYEIKQAKIPDEFLDGDKRVVNTGPIKPIKPPDPGGTPV